MAAGVRCAEIIPYNICPSQGVQHKSFCGHGRGRARRGSGRGVSSSPAVRAGGVAVTWCRRAAARRAGVPGAGLAAGAGAGAPVAAGVLTRAGGRGRVFGCVLCWGVGVPCEVSCACGRVGVWCFWVRLVMRGVSCGVMGWLVWSWLFGVVWFTLATKLAMQKHPISMLYLCWLANPFAGRNRLSGAGHWTLGFPSFPRRPLI